jgi:hypothetical protein
MFWAMIVTALVVAIVAAAAWVFVIAPFWVPGRHHGAK